MFPELYIVYIVALILTCYCIVCVNKTSCDIDDFFAFRCSLRVNGELTSVSFRLSDQCLIGLIDLFKSIKLPSAPEVTLDDVKLLRVRSFLCLSFTGIMQSLARNY